MKFTQQPLGYMSLLVNAIEFSLVLPEVIFYPCLLRACEADRSITLSSVLQWNLYTIAAVASSAIHSVSYEWEHM